MAAPDRFAHSRDDGLGRLYPPPAEVLEAFLGGVPWVQIRQERPTALGGVIHVDMGTRYAVNTSEGSGLCQRQENAGAFMARFFLAALVTQRFELHDSRDNPMLLLERQFEKLVLSRMVVSLDDGGEPGRRLGVVERNWRLTSTQYTLKDGADRPFATLVRPLTSLWQFRLETTGTPPVLSGAVAKEWSGLATEMFSRADDFGIDYGHHRWTTHQRAVITAAAIAIDLDLFDRGGKGVRMGSVFDLLD